MWSAIINLLGAVRDSANKYQWRGWTHCTSGGRHPKGHDVCTIGLQAVITTAKTVLNVFLKCRYYQNRDLEDKGPAEATEHWYELLIEDMYCAFGRRVLVELYSEPKDATYAAHKNSFEAARSVAVFCSDQTRHGKEELIMEMANLLNLTSFGKTS